MMTQSTDMVTADNIFDIISNAVNDARIHETFYKVVDPEHYWDGKIKSCNFRKVMAARGIYECCKMLTFGTLSITCFLNKTDTAENRFSVHIGYYLPFKVRGMVREQIARTIKVVPSDVNDFVRLLQTKLRSLVDAVTLEFCTEDFTRMTNSESYMHDMSKVVGKLRLLTKIGSLNNMNNRRVSEMADLSQRIADLFTEGVNDASGTTKASLYMSLV